MLHYIETNRDIISLFINFFGVIATFLACYISLWQTKYSSRKKIKLRLQICFIDGKREYITVNITNVGNRTVNIKEVAIYLKKQGNKKMIFNDTLSQLPKKIDIEESVDININFSTFLENMKLFYDKKLVSKHYKPIFGIRDTTNHTTYIKDKLSIYSFLKQENKL